MVETQRDTEGNAVLRCHQIFRLVNGMMRYQFFDSANDDLPDVLGVETVLLREFFQPFDGRMSINMAGVPFDADIERLELPSQTKSQLGKVRRVGKGPAKSQLPLENTIRPCKPAPCQRRGGHAPFPPFSQAHTLDHPALLSTRKYHQPAAIRARDAQRMDHFIFVETQKPSARHRGAEGSGQSGGVETAFLQRISRSDADATHDLTGRYEGGQESFPVRLLHFARSEGRDKCSCAGVNAGARLTNVVQLKSMRHGSVG